MFGPIPSQALVKKYGERRADVIIEELRKQGLDVYIDKVESFYSGGTTVYVFPPTRSMSDLYWYRTAIITVIVAVVLWLITSWVFPNRIASAIEESILVLAIIRILLKHNPGLLKAGIVLVLAFLLYVYYAFAPKYPMGSSPVVSAPVQPAQPHHAARHHAQTPTPPPR